VAEGISALESSRIAPGSDKCVIDVDVLSKYIPRDEQNLLPATAPGYSGDSPEASAEREAIIRSIFQLKQDVEYLKKIVMEAGLMRGESPAIAPPDQVQSPVSQDVAKEIYEYDDDPEDQDYDVREPEDMSIKTSNMELIEKVLRKHDGNRKAAAAELGISERTLYRKIKQLGK
jgi:DNA-binding protein Fis